MSYFEPQNDKDCTIHSINNAMGRRVISKREVLSHIGARVKVYAAKLGLDVRDERVKVYRNKLSTDSTFFSAEAVWKAAEELGHIGKQVPVPGYGGKFTKVASLPTWVREKSSIVLLGLDAAGGMHAVAVREGKLLDSQLHNRGYRPFTDKELSKSLSNIFAAYVIYEPSETPHQIKRTQPASTQV